MSALLSRRKLPFLSRTIGRKRLNPGLAERGILREQEIAAPETLARDRPVGLRVDGENDARRVVRLRHALHQHQQVPVRIGVHGPGAQRVLVQRHRIKIGVVVGRRACARFRNGRRRRRSANTSRTPARVPPASAEAPPASSPRVPAPSPQVRPPAARLTGGKSPMARMTASSMTWSTAREAHRSPPAEWGAARDSECSTTRSTSAAGRRRRACTSRSRTAAPS